MFPPRKPHDFVQEDISHQQEKEARADILGLKSASKMTSDTKETQTTGSTRGGTSSKGRSIAEESCEEDVEYANESMRTTTVEKTPPRKWGELCSLSTKPAVRFGLRLSIVLTLSSLFVLVESPEKDDRYPQGTWVYVSALIVSWFPSMDVASVAQKTFQRILGTIMGAILGLCCGCLSSLIESYAGQAVFIGFSIATVTFCVSFSMVQGFGPFHRYPYACLLCLMTFGITILPFYTENEDEWRSGVIRVTNVIIGCGIAALGAIVLWPRSSKVVLKEKVEEQVKLAGEASEAVLQFASKTLGSRVNGDESFSNILTESKVGVEDYDDLDDSAYRKYIKAIGDFKSAQSVFPLSKYDPYNLCRDTESFESYRKESALTLSRALRMQSTIILMDGALRRDYDGGRCTEREAELFQEIGGLIKTMLNPPCNKEKGDVAAERLLGHMNEIREFILQESAQVAASASSSDRKLFRGSLEDVEVVELLSTEESNHSSKDDHCTILLFLQLVDNLMVRSLRLYVKWSRAEW